MITIQKTYFDFQTENETFAQVLYGQWDHFYRMSFEKIAEEILTRYDRADELVRIESLDLDLGEVEEDRFYDDFPRLLARKLEETLTAYLAHKEAYPKEITVIPIQQSLMERFSFYLLHGYLSWEEEPGRWDFPAVLAELIRTNAEDVLRFLREEGTNATVRERLVFQLADRELERLVGLVAPSDTHFISAYVVFLIRSHRQLERPEITVNDYRNVVWLVVWSYLLAESKGYYSRKQLVYYTLQQLAARYNIRFFTLLDMLTGGLRQFIPAFLVAPELLVLLVQIREERLAREKAERHSAGLSAEELRALLSDGTSCREFLKDKPEEVIYELVQRVIPPEAPFVIGYAQSLDKEKEKGMLEGKAGEEFRLLKWEFIFLVLLQAPQGTFSRLQFAYSVLERLAAHYNLQAYELLAYFYRSLITGEIRTENYIRDLIHALFWQQTNKLGRQPESSSAGISVVFPVDLKETLADVRLCRRFLQPLSEEKIYGLVEQVIPSESPYIIRYAKVLDKGKERNVLEGKAGTEFRLLKWEFIFLVVLGAPSTYFNRKQFTRSVLQQIAAHYNLETTRLLSFFCENWQTEFVDFPVDLHRILSELYEEIVAPLPESLFVRRRKREEYPAELLRFLSTGETELPLAVLVEFVKEQERIAPDVLLGWIEPLKKQTAPVRQIAFPGADRLWALILRIVINRYALSFPRLQALLKRLEDIETNRRSAPAGVLNSLLYYCIQNRPEAFQRMLDELLGEKSAEKIEPKKAVEPKEKDEPHETVGQKQPVRQRAEEEAENKVGQKKEESTLVAEVQASSRETFLFESKAWAYRRLRQIASASYRSVLEEVLFLMAALELKEEEVAWIEVLSSLARAEYAYYSRTALLRIFWEKLAELVPASKRREVLQAIRKQAFYMPGLAGLAEQAGVEEKRALQEKPVTVYIRNAGLVLLAPFFPRLFGMLNLLDEKKRLTERENQIKAIFALQYLVTEETTVPEYELFLNKLLTGYRPGASFPCFLSFEEAEKQILVSLLENVGKLWDKLKNTSIQGFRNSLLLRDGVVEEQEDKWLLSVEPRAYDLLLDTVPWGFSPIKFLWMEKPIYVKWR